MSILTETRAEVEAQGIDWNSICLFAPQQVLALLLGGNPEPFRQFVEETFLVTLSGYTTASSNDQTKLETLSVPSNVQFYSYFCIWAEESASLGAGSTEWAYGNGDDTPATLGGIFVGVDCELIAIGLNCENGTANVRVLQNGADTSSESGTVTSPGGITQLATPLAFSVGDRFNFRTVSASGTTSGRAVAWFRISAGNISGFKGDKGDKGLDGINGVPSQYARISLNTISNINQASVLASFNTITAGNIAGIVVNSNSITLEAGSYEVSLTGNVSTTAQRSNIGTNFYINGSLYSSKNGQNYIRSANGHNESAIDFNDMFTLGSTQDIEFEFTQQAVTGTVVLANTSWITIKKIA